MIDRTLAKASYRTGGALQDAHDVSYRTLRCACCRLEFLVVLGGLVGI